MHVEISDPKLRDAADTLCKAVQRAGGRALLVGGSVRDAFLGKDAKDLDFEVYQLSPEGLKAALGEHFEIDLVGESFGVLKIHHLPIDVALPRRESKRGLGHKGFEVHSDPSMSLAEAAARRDFTINAISWDPLTQEVIDPADGVKDLNNRLLRHVSDKFSEDPLRVLRAMQFAARFSFYIADDTVALCRTIEPEGLSRERLWEEWKKLVLRGVKISRGLDFLRDCGWVQYYPELEALIDCPQDPQWHPEGDVWVHTLHVMDAFAEERLDDETEDLTVGFGCLCHDFGKPATTTHDPDGRIRSKFHEEEGAEPTRLFLERLTNQENLIRDVVALVVDHLKPFMFYRDKSKASAIRRLASRVGRIDRLVRVARADHKGRPPLVFDGFPAGEWLLKKASEMDIVDDAPQPIVLGRHLIELGLKPGKHFGKLLNTCFEAQLDGRFADEEGGREFVRGVVEEWRADESR